MTNKDLKSDVLKRVLGICFSLLYRGSNKIGFKPYSTQYNPKRSDVVVSKSKKIIYIVNPLAASRSILSYLLEKSNTDDFSFVGGVKKSDIMTKKEFKKFTVFSVCRNPWERLVSSYNKKVLNANNIKKIAILSQYAGVYPQMDFQGFTRWLVDCEKYSSLLDPHWVEQHAILTTEDDQLICSELLRLEQLQGQFAAFTRKVGLEPSELPSKAASSDQMYDSLFEDYRRYYSGVNSEVLEGIAKKYEKDCLAFGYPSLHEYLVDSS